MVKFIAKISALIYATIILTGFGAPEHSKVQESMTPKESELVFKFLIEMKDGIMVNDEGPWQLDIEQHEHLNFEKTRFDLSDLDQDFPGYKIATSGLPNADQGELSYRLIAFVCTKDKSRCYRETHTGSIEWAKQ